MRLGLHSGDAAIPRETQSQGSSQDPSNCCEGLRSSRRRTSQGVLYSDFLKGELQRLLARSKARVDAASENGYHDERVRHRNWLSSILASTGRLGYSHRYASRPPLHASFNL